MYEILKCHFSFINVCKTLWQISFKMLPCKHIVNYNLIMPISILGLKVFQHHIQSIVYDFWVSEGGRPFISTIILLQNVSIFPMICFLYLLRKMYKLKYQRKQILFHRKGVNKNCVWTLNTHTSLATAANRYWCGSLSIETSSPKWV